MPYESNYVDADIFHEYKGVTIYHTYNQGEYDDPSSCYFTTHPEWADSEDEAGQHFDARELPDFDKNDHPPFVTGDDDTPENRLAWEKWHAEDSENRQYKRAIELAIDKGIIKSDSKVFLTQEERTA